MAVVAYRLEGLNLDQRAGKPFEILVPSQLAIQPRRTGFQRVLGTRNQIFHIQQYAKIPAERGAILVCDAGELLDLELARLRLLNQPFGKFPGQAFGSGFNCRLKFRAPLGVFFEEYAQDTFFRRTGQFNFDHVQPMRGRHSYRRCPDCFQLDCHRPLRSLPRLTPKTKENAPQGGKIFRK